MKKQLEFTEAELNVILYSLQKQPFEIVNELIKNIVLQLQPKVVEEPKQNV